MGKNIFEETPARGSHAKGDNPVEKQASQLAYDVKYKVKQSLNKGTKLNPAQVSKAYMSQLAKSPAPPAVKALAKKKLVGEEHTSDISELVEKSMVNALVKVFVENVNGGENEEVLHEEETGEKKYKVRVTDKKTGNTYVRNATRAKIAELRANPNISSVEMTQYGEPSKSEKEKGASTAKAKSGKGLDPVGREDSDIDNDGDTDKTDKYLHNRRKVRGAAIAKRKGVSEEFLGEVKKKEESEKIDIAKGVKNKVKVFPEVKEEMNVDVDKKIDPALKRAQQQKITLLQRKIQAVRSTNDSSITASFEPNGETVQEVAPPGAKYERMVKHIKAGYADGGLTKKEKSIAYATAWKAKNKAMKEEACGCEDEKEPKLKKSEGGVEDSREIPTKLNLAKNKLRAMGLKMSYEPEGEVIDERTRERKGQPRPERNRATEMIRKMPEVKKGLMTRSGKTVAQHEKERGVKKEPGAPTPKGETTADRLEAKKRKAAIAKAAAQRAQDNMSSRFD